MLEKVPHTENWSVLVSGGTQNHNLYAIVDGLELPDLAGHVMDRHPRQDTGLLTGQLAADYELHMPRLVKLDAELLEWLIPIIQADIRWGFFAIVRGEISQGDEALQHESLLEHFQSWSHITTPYRESWLFRFYDAAVTRAFFEYASDPEIASFLGPCSEILLVAPDLTVESLSMEQLPDPWISRPHPIAPLRMELMQGLHTVTHQRLFGRFKAHLREHHPVTTEWPDEQLDTFVKDGVLTAWNADFKSEQDMVRFLSLQVILGADFTERADCPWVQPILTTSTAQGTQTRMDRLFDRAVVHLQQA